MQKNANKILNEICDGAVLNYPTLDGVPILLAERDGLNESWKDEQNKTTDTFSEKWSRFKNYGMKDEELNMHIKWFCKKFGLTESE